MRRNAGLRLAAQSAAAPTVTAFLAETDAARLAAMSVLGTYWAHTLTVS
jgi:hypothetical protein